VRAGGGRHGRESHSQHDEPRTPTAQPAPEKKSLHDSQRATPRVKRERRVFAEHVEAELCAVLDRLHFLDESGAHLGLTRLCGRAKPGQRVVEATPGYSGPHYTTVAALSLAGVKAPWVIEGAMDGAAFVAYVRHALGPVLQPGDIVLFDNLSAHKNAEARALIEARQAQIVYLPPYSPDFNPIELCWSKVKQALRSAKARTFAELLEALRETLLSVTPQQVQAWFKHCGYALA
jgi:transposase